MPKKNRNKAPPSTPQPAAQWPSATSGQKPIASCRNFEVRGTCSFGTGCKFSHSQQPGGAAAPLLSNWEQPKQPGAPFTAVTMAFKAAPVASPFWPQATPAPVQSVFSPAPQPAWKQPTAASQFWPQAAPAPVQSVFSPAPQPAWKQPTA